MSAVKKRKSWGIITGDTISPALFLAYTFDFDPPLSIDDIMLQDVHITRLAFADDIICLLLADAKLPSITRMQERLTWVEVDYCGKTVFLEINATKSVCCLIGAKAIPSVPLTITGGSQDIEFVDEFRYTGVHICSDINDPFRPHYKAWSSKARSAAHALFSTETFVGSIPVPTAVNLYYALVDPYLIFGCEVVVDVTHKHLRTYEAIQIYCLRRLLGLQPRSPTAILYVLTGVTPIRYRHIDLQLRYAKYALMQPENHYANRAYRDAIALHMQKKRSWITDIEKALKKLPFYPVTLAVDNMRSTEGIQLLMDKVQVSCARFLCDGLNSPRTPLLHTKYLPVSPNSLQTVVVLRKFLRTIKIPAHRKAVTKLLCADHPLAVEQLRRKRRPDGSRIEPECRSCRYCDDSTETEIHALFRCEGPIDGILKDRRSSFLQLVWSLVGPSGPWLVGRCNSDSDDTAIVAIHYFLEHDLLAPIFAKYVYDILQMFPVSL